MEVKSGHDVKFTYVSCNRDKKVKQFDVESVSEAVKLSLLRRSEETVT
jgi:hypothetical protein